MSSVSPAQLPPLPTYDSITTSRLRALYADFTYQKQSNPSSYASNIEWWRQTLEAALVRGWFADAHGAGTSTDRIVLHAPGMSFSDRFRVEGVGKPLSIPTALSELCHSKALIPLADFLSATRSIYDPGWLPYRIATLVVGKPLWWALGQLGVVDSHGLAFGDSGATERWKKVRGDYVMVSLLEGAAARILDYQKSKSTGQMVDLLYTVEGFKAEFATCAFKGSSLSATDVKVLLKFLERDRAAIVISGDVIKFVDEHSSHSSEITAVDSGLLALKTSVQKLHVQIDHIQRRIDELTRQISDALRQKRKDFAMTYLRNRKQHEDVLKKRLSSLELLQSTLLRVETSAGDIEIMKSYESSTVTLREILAHPLLQRDKIDETMEALAAANDDARDVSNAIRMGTTVAQGETVDDAELEAELQALVNEAEVEKAHTQQRLTEDKLRAPTHTPDAEETPTQSTSSLDKMAVPA